MSLAPFCYDSKCLLLLPVRSNNSVFDVELMAFLGVVAMVAVLYHVMYCHQDGSGPLH
jgi:hypothetical protein